jgi:hypothetical protein
MYFIFILLVLYISNAQALSWDNITQLLQQTSLITNGAVVVGTKTDGIIYSQTKGNWSLDDLHYVASAGKFFFIILFYFFFMLFYFILFLYF